MSISKENKKNKINAKGHADGYWELHFSNGCLSWKGSYIDGVRDGWWEDYFLDGQLHWKGNFVNGNKDGWWEEYDENGILTDSEFYVNI